MLFHELESDGSWKFVLEFHPRITVLAGLSAPRRAEMAMLLENALYGRASDLRADVRVGSQRLDLEQWAELSRGSLERVDLIVREQDLPGADGAVPDGFDDGDLRQSLLDAQADLDRSAAEVDVLGRAVAAATCQCEEIEARGPSEEPAVDPRVTAAQERLVIAEGVLAQARDRLSTAVALGAAAASAVSDAQAARSRELAAAAEADQYATARALDAARQRMDEADAALATAIKEEAEASEQVAAATDALATLRQSVVGAPTVEASTETTDLVARTVELIEHRQRLSAAAAPAWLVASARVALEVARVELARAEGALRPLMVSAADAADLERAHAAATEAEEKAERALAGPLARRRLSAARAVERGVLDRLGIPSYGAYLLRRVSEPDGVDAEVQVHRARRAAADAEAVWEEVRLKDQPEEQASLEAAEAEVRTAAAAIVGAVDAEEPMPELAARLRSSESAPESQGDQPALVAAEGALTDAESAAAEATDRVDGARQQASDAAAELARLEAAPQAEPAQADPVPEVAAVDPDLAAAQSAVAAAESEVASARNDLDEAHATASSAPAAADSAAVEATREAAPDAALEAALEAARRDERAAQRRHQEATAAAAQAAYRVAEADERLTAARAAARAQFGAGDEATETNAEIYFLARLAAVRSVGDFGSLPVVMIDPLVNIDADETESVLSLLTRMSEIIQVVYLCDRTEIVDWAQSLGPEMAAIRRFGRPVRDPAS